MTQPKANLAVEWTILFVGLLLSLCPAKAFPQKPTDPTLITKYEAAERLYGEAVNLERGTEADKREAIEKYTAAAAILSEIGSRRDRASLLNNIGIVYDNLGEKQKALEFYNEALPIHRAVGNKTGEATTLSNIGVIYDNLGEKQKALEFHNQALPIQRDIGDKRGEATTLNNIGIVYNNLGEKQKALEFYDQVLPIRRAIGDKSGEATTLSNIGAIYDDLGEKQRALEFFNQALPIERSLGEKSGETTTLNNIGLVYSSLGEKQKALEFYYQALPIERAVGDRRGEATTLNNIGAVYDDLGEKQKALEFYDQALPIRRAVGDKSGEAMTLSNIGGVHNSLGEKQKALEFYNQALPIDRAVGDRRGEATTLGNIGAVYDDLGDKQTALEFYEQTLPIERAVGDKSGEASTLNNMGLLYSSRGEKQEALEFYNQALPIKRAVGDRSGEATALNNIGSVYSSLGDKQKALEFYNQALPIERSVRDTSREAITLSSLQTLWQGLGNSRLAVLYGKQSINKFQELRQEIKGLEKATQKTYLGTIESRYKSLADLLIAEGRLAEAQEVMAMLKEEEVFEYLKRDAAEAESLSRRADLRADEADALKRYSEIADKIGSIGAEFSKIQAVRNKLPEGSSLSAADQKHYDELSKQLEEANTVFQVFLRGLADEFAKKPKVVENIQENTGLQADLKSWGEGVVSLYTIVGDDRYRVILTTPDVQTDGKTEIKAADLNKKISDFRAAVQDPKVDPRPLGKELYDIVVKPVEKQLEGAKAKTLLWSLDGTLRYLPLAALWDGKQYFGEKYQNVLITLASRTRLSEEPKSNWHVLGLGVTGANDVTEPNGTKTIHFPALPSVRTELMTIVQDEQHPDEKGVLAGKRLLDADFTEQALKDRLWKGYNAVHIASHFSFRPGDMTKSFLLLGDGSILTMDKVKTSPQLKFAGVELLVLSACQTAVGETDANGSEVESFGVIAQQNGAKAVMATLWSVADQSTSLLMSEFYRTKKENPAMTKAEALQRAQIGLMSGKYSSGDQSKTRADLVPVEAKNKSMPAFEPNPKAPYAHPFYWSPFVLIGNWR
jgi:CHAT domain-containing protein/tetratricopeptide (TPR) repeat protein